MADDSNGNQLDALFTRTHPLGPSAVDHPFAISTLSRIYEPGVEPYEREPPETSSYIMGRRGSGKTTLLASTSGFGVQPALELYQSDVLTGMRDVVLGFETRVHVTLSLDHRVELWKSLFCIAGAAYLCNERSDTADVALLIELREFLAGLEGTSGYPLRTPTEVVRAFQDEILLRAHREGVHGTFTTWLDRIEFGGVPIRTVCRNVDEILRTEKRQLVILIDSLEELTRRPEYYADVLRPLFCLLGRQARAGAQQAGLHVRCCLPTELSKTFDALSDNPAKDFLGVCVIQWTTRDLIILICSRFRIFGDVLAARGTSELRDRIRTGPKHPQALLESFLPQGVLNLCGQREDTLPYLFRHTQLLPRQLLILMNRLVAGDDRIERLCDGERILSTEVIEAVQATEHQFTSEVLNAHRSAYPNASDVLGRLLPNLPSRFSLDDLAKVYEKLSLRAHIDDFDKLKTMLLQLGVVGRVDRETRYYVRGQFAYTYPTGLVPADTDELCLHPMFSQYMGRRPSAKKPIYPAAAHIDDEPLLWSSDEA